MKSTFVISMICFFIVSCEKEYLPTQSTIVVDEKDHITAKYGFNKADAVAISMDSTVMIKHIQSSDVNYDGTSKSWSYMYTSSVSPAKNYFFTVFFDSVRLDQISTEPLIGGSELEGTWINSDYTLYLAETNGGREFRNNCPDCRISTEVGGPEIPGSPPIWNVEYYSITNANIYMGIGIDAYTGAILYTDLPSN